MEIARIEDRSAYFRFMHQRQPEANYTRSHKKLGREQSWKNLEWPPKGLS
jgi:hypothetical protein